MFKIKLSEFQSYPINMKYLDIFIVYYCWFMMILTYFQAIFCIDYTGVFLKKAILSFSVSC